MYVVHGRWVPSSNAPWPDFDAYPAAPVSLRAVVDRMRDGRTPFAIARKRGDQRDVKLLRVLIDSGHAEYALRRRWSDIRHALAVPDVFGQGFRSPDPSTPSLVEPRSDLRGTLV